MVDSFEEIITNMGGKVMGEKPGKDKEYGLLNPGQIIHEVGTTRMGNDPKTSARKIYKIELTLNNQIKRFTSRISNGESIKDYLIDLPVE